MRDIKFWSAQQLDFFMWIPFRFMYQSLWDLLVEANLPKTWLASVTLTNNFLDQRCWSLNVQIPNDLTSLLNPSLGSQLSFFHDISIFSVKT